MFSVLYVDDEHDLLEIGKLFLEQYPDLRVDIHISAKEALASPNIGKYDAIVSDYQMPEMDGIEFLKTVRGKYGDVPFILFTGRGREEIVIQAINNGVDFYLQKGGDVRAQFAELAHKIRQAVARRKAEISLIESEKRLSDIINFLPDATFAINRDGIIIAWNRAIEEMTGLPADAILGKGDHEYALPFYGERRPILIDLIFEPDEVIEQDYSHIVRQKDILIADTTLPRLKGKEVTLLGKASPLYNSQGEIVGAIEAIRDITLQKTAEDELRAAYEQITASEEELRDQLDVLVESEQRVKESEEKYRLLVELSPIAVVVHREGKIVYANPEAIRLAGVKSLEDFIGRDVMSFVHPDYHAEALEDFRLLFEEGKTIPLKEEILLTLDKNPFTVEVTAMPLLYQRLPSALVVFRDITERKRAEMAVRLEKDFSRMSLDSLPGIFYIFDKHGRFLRWNKNLETISGYSGEEITRMSALDFFVEADRTVVLKRIHEVFVAGEGIIEARFLSKDQKQTPMLMTGSRIELDGKEYLIGMGIDITEKRKTADELQAAYEQITASEEELRDQLDVLEASEKKIRESEARLRYMIGFYEKAKGPEGDLLSYAVEGAGAVTGSPLGYLAFLNDDETELSMYAWSRSAMEECAIRDKPIVYKTAKTGLWGEAVRQRRAVITNDYAAPNPAKKGYPPGHPGIVRHMNVPIMDGGHIVVVAGVANKPADYTDTDVQELQLLMQSLWLVIKRRRTEGALLESEEKYRDLFENSVLGIFRTTREGKFSAINSTFARIAGYDSPQQMMETIKDVRTQLYVNPDDRDRFVNGLTTDGFVKDFEAPYYHRDGHAIWILINARAVRDLQGEVRYYEGTIEDITGQKKDKEALLREKLFSDAVLESIPGLLYLYDSDGKLVRWNKSHETVSGYSAEELAGMHLPDWFTGDDEALHTISEGVGRAMKEGQSSAVAKLLTKSGKRIPFFFTAKRLEIEGKTYFTGVGIDITDRQRDQDELRAAYEQLSASQEELQGQLDELVVSEQRIRESEVKYRELAELLPQMVFEMDPDFRVTYANRYAFSALGLTGQDIAQGFSALSCIDPGQHDRARRAIETLIAGKPEANPEYTAIRKDGTTFPALVYTAPVYHAGVLAGFRGVVVDITDRKQAEDALKESEERYRNVIELSPLGMHFYELLPDGPLIFTGANPAADSILGIDNNRFIGKPIEEAFPGLLGTEIPDQYRKVAADGGVWHTDQMIYDQGEIRGAFAVQASQIRPGAMVAVFYDITKRKQAEAALRESEEKYRTILETIQDVYYRSDVAGNLVMASPSIAGLLGYERVDVLIGRNIAEDIWLYPGNRQAFIDEMKKQGSVSNYEVILKRKDGSPVTVATSSHFHYDPQGEVDGVEGIFHDITAIRNADQQINLLAALIDISPVSVTVHDTEGRFLYANQRTLVLHGYTREEFMTLNLHQLDVPVSEELINERIGLLKKQGETSFDVEHFRKDGSRIPLHVTAKIARWNDRDMILSVATDLSERLDAERILSESEALYRTVIENIQDAFIRSDRDGRIIMASLSAATMLGFDKPDDLIGKSMSAFYQHPELRQVLLDKMAKDGKIADQTIELRRNDGSMFWGSANFHCLYNAKGEMDGVEGSLHDITGYRAMERALREANHKLNLLNSMTRHDVTNQLTALQGFAQIAAMKKGDPVMADYLAKIMTAADTIARQIEFTRTYQELGVKAPAWTTVEDVIARVESRVPVTFSGTCRGIEILADPMLERVFFNLFDNAVRHGGRVTEITVRCEREPDGILVIVEDNGAGVPAAEKEKIFERGIGKNTGLGLFLVREILSITGITIKETGVFGKGARFEISVPEGMYRFVRP